MKVCIAEKPSVAAEIAKILGASQKREGYYEGKGYQVTWTFGHLCRLKSPESYYPSWKKWSIDNIPMLPPKYEIELIPDPGVKKQFKTIKNLFQKADVIINCGDAGQEGELIQRWVMELAGVRCPVQRLWISSLTEEAIREGFNALHPQRDYDSLYMAGKARAEGDWLLGMNATRLYTLKYGGYKQVLSIGRVQTPTLAMIVARDKEIDNFKPEPYWVLTTRYRGVIFSSFYGHIKSQSEGQQFLQTVQGQVFSVLDIKLKNGRESAPQLYDLTSLQVDCNKKYGMSAERTLSIIQGLYEKKLTTYPRVDTKYLPDDVYPKIRWIIGNLKDYEDLAERFVHGNNIPKPRRVFDNNKVTDHHAIIPTGDYSHLHDIKSDELKVYDLIVRRFMAVFYPDCEYATTTVIGRAADIEFRTSGKTILNPGWHIVYDKVITEEEKDTSSEEETAVLPKFTVGESGSHVSELTEKMTTPPKRYTEASLLQAMETAGKMVDDETLREAMKENGIGRPSSRASIIETLIKREYIKRQKKYIISTQVGCNLIDVIDAKMLKSPELTGQWEKKLREIEHGNYSLDSFMEELSHQLIEITKAVKEKKDETKIFSLTQSSTPLTNHKNSSSKTSSKRTLKIQIGDRCPVCGKGTVRKSQFGGFYCSDYRTTGCKFRGN